MKCYFSSCDFYRCDARFFAAGNIVTSLCGSGIKHYSEIGYSRFSNKVMRFIYDLEALLNVLEDKCAEWQQSFRDYWSVLEITYAMFLDAEQSRFARKKNKLSMKQFVV